MASIPKRKNDLTIHVQTYKVALNNLNKEKRPQSYRNLETIDMIETIPEQQPHLPLSGNPEPLRLSFRDALLGVRKDVGSQEDATT